MHIEITDEVDKKALTRNRWIFRVDAGYGGASEIKCTLDRWSLETRESPRHKFVKLGEGYQGRAHNGAIHYGGWRKPAAEVPMPSQDEIGAKVISSLRIIGAIDPKEK